MINNPLISKRPKSQCGSILVVAALILILLLGASAVAIDGGHILLIRQELKNAADAAALAGASHLYPADADGKPNWSVAHDKAALAIYYSKADNLALNDGQIETGYWDLSGAISRVRPPESVPAPGKNDIPAVMVTLSKTQGKNGGPVSLYFGSLIGVKTKDVSAQSVAASGPPKQVGPNMLFPITLPLNLYNKYWDSSIRQPKINLSTGEPFVFEINNEGNNGNWTSFEIDSDNVPTIKDYMDNGNPTPLSIGQQIWVVPGTKSTIYSSVPSNIDVTVAILPNTMSHSYQTIAGFGALHIRTAKAGSSKSITVNLIGNRKTNLSDPGGGAYYGTYTSARLIK